MASRRDRNHGEIAELDAESGVVVKRFEAPSRSVGGLDAEAAATLIAAAADVSLILDGEGVIRDVAFGSDELSQEGYGKWVGQPWAETVTLESRPKIEALLRDAATKSTAKWRHVNHPSQRGGDVPVLYSAVQLGQEGRVVAFGRDLRSVAALQQRLVDAQQSMERDYWRLRHLETRYRLLFQMASEAVLIVDAASLKIVEANPAAGQMLGENAKRVIGRVFPEGFDPDGTQSIQALLAAVRATGKAEDVRVRLLESSREFVVSASLFRQDNSSLFLVRLSPLHSDSTVAAMPKTILKVVENAPDGFVVTDPDGVILVANPAFIHLAQLPTEELARGESLEKWLGRPGVDFGVLISNLRQHGSVRLFATIIRGEQGATEEVEVSAVSVPHGEQPCLGFTIRNIGLRLMSEVPAAPELPRSVQQLTKLVGRVSLKDLVRESTDLIEKLSIEAALELTGDNRASAAEMLGLSRQSLYVKLRRHGLGDLAPENEK